MAKVVLIDLDGKRTEREETGALIPYPPLVLHHDNRPFVRKRMLAGDDRLIYQEASCSWLAPHADSKRHPREEDCLICEAENANLRALVAWVSASLRTGAEELVTSMTRAEIAEEIAVRLDRSSIVEDGGVTVDSREEEREAIRDLVVAAGRLADLAEAVADSGNLITAAKAAEAARTVRDKVQEVEEVLGPSLHEARQKEKK